MRASLLVAISSDTWANADNIEPGEGWHADIHIHNSVIIITIFIKNIYIAQVRRGHKCAMLAEMAVW